MSIHKVSLVTSSSIIASSIFLLVACDSSSNAPELQAQADAAVVLASNPYGDGSACADILAGANQITIDGKLRSFEVVLPENPEGAPLVFAWHWLGGTSSQILNSMKVADMANQGAIVIAPTSTGLPVEWDVLGDDPEQSIDLKLFDQLLTCGWESFHVDTDRVFSTGMSAGGLFTSYVSMHRSEHLASTVVFSGGVQSAQYAAPATDLPMVLVWGGPSDMYAGYSFHDATLEFSEALRNDGHFIVECEHTAGHLPPSEASAMAWAFFQDHPRGMSPEPWAELPTSYPSYCAIP